MTWRGEDCGLEELAFMQETSYELKSRFERELRESWLNRQQFIDEKTGGLREKIKQNEGDLVVAISRKISMQPAVWKSGRPIGNYYPTPLASLELGIITSATDIPLQSSEEILANVSNAYRIGLEVPEFFMLNGYRETSKNCLLEKISDGRFNQGNFVNLCYPDETHEKESQFLGRKRFELLFKDEAVSALEERLHPWQYNLLSREFSKDKLPLSEEQIKKIGLEQFELYKEIMHASGISKRERERFDLLLEAAKKDEAGPGIDEFCVRLNEIERVISVEGKLTCLMKMAKMRGYDELGVQFLDPNIPGISYNFKEIFLHLLTKYSPK